MKTSEIVENLKVKNQSSPIQTEKELKLNDDLVNKAYVKVCELWNNEKGRGFIINLINEFFSPDITDEILQGKIKTHFTEEEITANLNRCCLLNIKIAGSEDIVKALSEVKNKEDLKKLPVEIRTATSAYCTKVQHKYISNGALYALKEFVENCVLAGEKSIMYLVIPKPEPKDTGLAKTMYNTFEMSNFLDEETIKKLQKI